MCGLPRRSLNNNIRFLFHSDWFRMSWHRFFIIFLKNVPKMDKNVAPCRYFSCPWKKSLKKNMCFLFSPPHGFTGVPVSPRLRGGIPKRASFFPACGVGILTSFKLFSPLILRLETPFWSHIYPIFRLETPISLIIYPILRMETPYCLLIFPILHLEI